MKKKSTKRALISSLLILAMCFTMLAGTTFAWFTDSVTSSGNKIVSGKLDIALYLADANGVYNEITGASDPIFGKADSLVAQNNIQDTLWEPGKTQIAFLQIKNLGNLCAKYRVIIDVIDGGLIGSLEYAVIGNAEAGNYPAATLAQMKWTDITGAQGVESGDLAAGRITAANQGALAPAGDTYDATDAVTQQVTTIDDSDYFALAIHMKETAGNEYQEKDVTIDITVVATQDNVEEDSFDKNYDFDATLPAVASVTVAPNGAASSITAGPVTVALPANTDPNAAKEYRLDVSNASTEVDAASGETSVAFDATLYLNDTKVTSTTSGNIYAMTLTLPAGANVTSVKHNGTALTAATTGADQTYTYDPATGVLTIYTKSFSPVEVTYTVPIPVTGIALDQSALDVEMGTTATLTATVSPDNADDKTVTWTSSNEAVATVADGVVTGVAPGTATITAAAGDFSDACTVTVFKEFVVKTAWQSGNTVITTSGNFSPILTCNPSIVAYSIFDGNTRITKEVHFCFNRVEKQTIDSNTCKIIIDLEIKDADGNDLVLKPGNSNPYYPENGFEYFKAYINLLEAFPSGYSVSEVKVNNNSLTKTTADNPAIGEYLIGVDGIYLQSMTAGLIEVTLTKTN